MKRSLNCSHSISKNHSFREHEIFNTNNLAILGNNIIIWEPFKHIIINNNPLFDSNKIEHKPRFFLDIFKPKESFGIMIGFIKIQILPPLLFYHVMSLKIGTYEVWNVYRESICNNNIGILQNTWGSEL